MLAHADPLSGSTKSEIYRACLAAAKQNLFHSLRCYRASLRWGTMPLVSTTATDMLVLGSTPSDEVSVHEIGGQGAFVAKIRVSLWQKRMRAGAVIFVDFITRGRIWRLMFFTPSSSNVVGMWRVAVCLLEHSPPTFVDSILLIDLPPASNPLTSRASDLISLSPPSDDPGNAAAPHRHTNQIPIPRHHKPSKYNSTASIVSPTVL
ncbi:hypothetical protein L210DRAFT_426434 [Boletus edulis BED1]|uniref:Uncharacterized protein n=1 Tax=Boletus edulis BED1 TaxID=1328754 RepID=A0AAD4GAY9_BOLED|nr:hypothetical protein L210DRAFT_426434 [Boletus edulis BED1]